MTVKTSESGSESFTFAMINHLGTHIDFPKHFIRGGKSIDDFSPDFWAGHVAKVIECAKGPNDMISREDFEALTLDEDVTVLLVKTGFEQFRGEQLYWEENPGFAVDVATLLRSRFPQIKILGMDVISLSGFQNRPVGKLAHLEFLGSEDPILLLEDMCLENVTEGDVLDIQIAPLNIAGADGSPCTVIGKCRN